MYIARFFARNAPWNGQETQIRRENKGEGKRKGSEEKEGGGRAGEEGGGGRERENSRSLCRYLFEFMAVTRRLGTRKREEERTRENEG